MQIELDSQRMGGIITVDGVQISLLLLKMLANPDPARLYRMRRTEDNVTVMEVKPDEVALGK